MLAVALSLVFRSRLSKVSWAPAGLRVPEVRAPVLVVFGMMRQ